MASPQVLANGNTFKLAIGIIAGLVSAILVIGGFQFDRLAAADDDCRAAMIKNEQEHGRMDTALARCEERGQSVQRELENQQQRLVRMENKLDTIIQRLR